MIGVIVTFQYEDDFDRARVEKVAAEARPMFESMPRVRNKFFTVNDDARRARNFYAWESDEAARASFSDQVSERVTDLYGVTPEIEFVEIVELVDNSRS